MKFELKRVQRSLKAMISPNSFLFDHFRIDALAHTMLSRGGFAPRSAQRRPLLMSDVQNAFAPGLARRTKVAASMLALSEFLDQQGVSGQGRILK